MLYYSIYNNMSHVTMCLILLAQVFRWHYQTHCALGVCGQQILCTRLLF